MCASRDPRSTRSSSLSEKRWDILGQRGFCPASLQSSLYFGAKTTIPSILGRHSVFTHLRSTLLSPSHWGLFSLGFRSPSWASVIAKSLWLYEGSTRLTPRGFKMEQHRRPMWRKLKSPKQSAWSSLLFPSVGFLSELSTSWMCRGVFPAILAKFTSSRHLWFSFLQQSTRLSTAWRVANSGGSTRSSFAANDWNCENWLQPMHMK